jgi:DNA segregation ATPase FtsK/SpoIIIE-like protein
VAVVGRSYSYQGAKDEYLDLERHYHTLVAAMSGGGKSTLMRMALLTLAYGTAPADLRILLVDLKNDDLTTFKSLPHCISYAGDIDTAATAIDYVRQVKQERIASQDKPYRLLLVIDELAELSQAKDTLRQLGSILSTGRSLGINVMAGTQYPSAQAIGSIVAASFTTRLVGMVDGKNSAHVATKRAGSGAEHLQTPGDFLRIDGQDLVRMKAYQISQDDTAHLVQRIAGKWQGQHVDAVIMPTHDGHTARQPAIPDALLPIFERCTQADGTLQRGAMAACLRALFGDSAPVSGKRYQMEADKVNAWHIEYFTSLHQRTSLSNVTTSNEQYSGSEVKYSEPGKIIKLRTASGD